MDDASNILKRFSDLAVAFFILLFLFPLMMVIAWKIGKQLGSPVLFRQVRPGLHGKLFEMIKFRTMSDDVDVRGNKLPDSERLTSFGMLLRSTSMDELPELW